MAQLTPTQRYRQAMTLFELRIKRSIRLFTSGKVSFIEGGGDGGRANLIREIGRAYDAGFAAGVASLSPQQESST